MAALCNNNLDQQIRFSVWDKQNKMLNAVTTTINQLEAGNHSYNGAGGANLVIINYRQFIRPSFLDYMRAGWQISVVTAIDYTASNGNPS